MAVARTRAKARRRRSCTPPSRETPFTFSCSLSRQLGAAWWSSRATLDSSISISLWAMPWAVAAAPTRDRQDALCHRRGSVEARKEHLRQTRSCPDQGRSSSGPDLPEELVLQRHFRPNRGMLLLFQPGQEQYVISNNGSGGAELCSTVPARSFAECKGLLTKCHSPVPSAKERHASTIYLQ